MEKITVQESVLFSSKEFLESKDYWLGQLEEGPSGRNHFLFTVDGRGEAAPFFTLKADKEISARLASLSRGNRLSLSLCLMTAYSILLNKYKGLTQLCLGLENPSAGHPRYNEVVPIFFTLEKDQGFRSILSALSAKALAARRNGKFPLEKVWAEAGLASGERLYDLAFAAEGEISGNGYSRLSADWKEECVELRLEALPGGPDGNILLDHLHRVLGFCLLQPSTPVQELSLYSHEEEKALAESFHTGYRAVSGQNMVQAFEQQADRTPGATALVFRNESISYEELDRRSNQVANLLLKNGIQRGAHIPLFLSRSIEMIAAILGVMKAGGAYAPIDPAYPASRIDFLLADLDAAFVLTEAAYLPQLLSSDRLCLDVADARAFGGERPAVALGDNDAAYIIYTSGSTGNPKGVVVNHISAVNLVQSRARTLSFGSDERVLQFYNYTFDASVEQIFLTLFNGSALVLLPEESRLENLAVEQLLRRESITHLDVTPGFLSMLTPGSYGSLRRVISGGERCSTALAEAWMPHADFYNAYGPTEATVTATTHLCTPASLASGTVPIGRPLDSVRIYILSPEGKILPAGLTGEICIGGIQVAREYLNQPELTREKFGADPFVEGGRLYRTGDQGRWLNDGTVEYLGRTDEQVKIRGYRIELGEVESTLLALPGVEQAVVLAVGETGGNRLAAFIVIGESTGRAEVMQALRTQLPDYMVPGSLVVLPQLPLTGNGKVDRRKLLSLDLAEPADGFFEAPATPTQKTLGAIWESLLNMKGIGIHDSFFDIGGHSLLAMKMAALIRKQMGREVAIRDIFLNSTLAMLADLLDTQVDEAVIPPLTRTVQAGRIPLSFAQERLWFIDRLQGSLQYHMPYVFRLTGELRIDLLEDSLRTILQRHEVLRTVLREEDGVGYQEILPAGEWKMSRVSAEDILVDFGTLSSFVEETVSRPYDLANDYMLKVSLVELSSREFVLVSLLHHIAFDGWSIGLMVDELVELYRSAVSGRAAQLPALPVQYSDFAQWQRGYLQGELLAGKLAYWKDQLSGVAVLELPTDYPRPAERSVAGGGVSRTIDQFLRDRITAMCQQEGITMFMFMLAAFKVLLHRYTGQEDICVGSPTAGRDQEEVEKLIGFFINTMALRSQVNGSMTFAELLERVKQTTLEAYDHQDVPFEKIVEALDLERDRSRNAVFQVWMVLQNIPSGGNLSLEGVRMRGEDTGTLTSQFDINLNVTETETGIDLTMIYCRDLFSEDTMERMLGHFENLLRAITGNRDARVGYLLMLDPAEEQELIQVKEENKFTYPKAETLVSLFAARAKATPDAPALSFEGEETSYAELDARSTRLAGYLTALGVERETLVPICFDRSPEMIVAMMAVLKAGAAYVPIDPEHPASRIRFILEDTGASVALAAENFADLLEGNGRRVVCPGRDELKGEESAACEVLPQMLAYVIYTSGSTGMPKGVLIEHRSVVNLISYQTQYFGVDASDRILQFSNYSFDASVEQIYLALLNGACLVLLREEQRLEGLESLLTSQRITHLHATPGFLAHVEEGRYSSLKRVIAGGEFCRKELAQRWAGIVDFYNEYGPTETTVTAIQYHCRNEELQQMELVPIGLPLGNVRAYILDGCRNVVPSGVTGELYIAGVQVARGYLNRPELTAERFLDDPFLPGERMYRTGDLVRRMPDGKILFLGRNDEQVKIRGYRIELGEIENVLRQAAGVKDAVVLAKEDKSGTTRLVAYLVVEEHRYHSAEVMGYAREMLPEYMVPSVLERIERIPLTGNGKVDKALLLQKELTLSTTGSFEAPVNDTEKLLAAIWSELLDVEKISVHDNFFELGGDSIITIQVVSRARRQGLDFQVADIFTYQTIRKLADVIGEQGRKEEKEAGQEVLEGDCLLLPVQMQFLQQADGHTDHFNQSVVLAIEKSVDVSLLTAVFTKLIQRHDALRFRFGQTAEGWKQSYGNAVAEVSVFDASSSNSAGFPALLREEGAKLQAGLRLEEGELVRVALFQTPDDMERNRLLVVIHHLAVDGVSWRILLEDLRLLIEAGQKNEPLSLGGKTSSYRSWAQALKEYGAGKAAAQRAYWKEVVEAYRPLPADHSTNEDAEVRDIASCPLRLNRERTQQLLQSAPRVFRTDVNDILLCALAITLTEWSRTNAVVIGMEGHGREEALFPGMDLSQTVGWFTTLFPVLLDLEGTKDLGEKLVAVKEQLRRVPAKGVGYGVLKYMQGAEELQDCQPWDVIFNYLGQLDNVARNEGLLTPVGEPAGAEMDERLPIRERMLVDSRVSGGEFMVNWSYSQKHYRPETIQSLAQAYMENLEKLVAYCVERGQETARFTPSDFGLGDAMTFRQLNEFLAEPVQGRTRGELVEGMYRLTALQEGLLFHGLYEGGSAYAEQFSCTLHNLDTAAFRQAFQHLLERHTILRSSFHPDRFSVAVQCVYRSVELPVTVRDIRNLKEEEQLEIIAGFRRQDQEQGLEFTQAPLMRMALFQLKDDLHVMVWTYHHLIVDGWSMPVLMQEFMDMYGILSRGESLPAWKVDRYEDYIRFVEGRDREAQHAFWRRYLDGVEEPTLLPFVSKRSKKVAAFREEVLEISGTLADAVHAFARSRHVTLNTLMQGAWALLLHRYTGLSQAVFGVTVSGRPEELEGVETRVGIYTNTLAFRSHLQEGTSVADWLAALQSEQLEAREHQYISLSDLQSLVNVSGDLFDTMMSFQNYPVDEMVERQNALEASGVQVVEQTTNYPLSLRITIGQSMKVEFIYKEEELALGDVKKIGRHFRHVLQQMVSGAVQVEQIELLDEAGRKEVLSFTSSDVAYPSVTVLHLFAEQVKLRPSATAVVSEEGSLTYEELDRRSDALALLLLEKGTQRETIVPVFLSRSAAYLVAALAVLKAGGVYLPLEPTLPSERLSFILEDTKASLVLTSEELSDLLPANVLSIHTEKINSSSTTALPSVNPAQLAYVIYTSGSTGQPKGVLVEHRNLSNYLLNARKRYIGPEAKGTYLHLPSGFDASITSLLLPLVSGGKVVLAPADITAAEVFTSELFTGNAPYDYLKLTPAHLALLDEVAAVEEPLAARLVVGGEALYPAQLEVLSRYWPGVEIINEYGPTEATVGCSVYSFRAEEEPLSGTGGVLIGKPLDNVRLYVTDASGRLCPTGVFGELCIGGAQVARGYLNREELTQHKFIADVFSGEGRMYRTGDICRWTAEGQLEYLGRRDEQVKVRGYRIELGEIENALQRVEGVREAAVIVVMDSTGMNRLVGCVVKEEEVSTTILKETLRQRLPEYMIPQQWLELQTLPLTGNGKVDRKGLAMQAVEQSAGNGYEAPRNATEQMLVEIWQELLEEESIGIHDDFFALGGHSLLAIRLISHIKKESGKELAIKDVFDHPTIAGIACLLEDSEQASPGQTILPATRNGQLPLSFSQEQLWLMDQLKGTVEYHMPYVFTVIGALDIPALQEAFRQMVDRHEILRTVILENEQGAYQSIRPAEEWNWQYRDVSEETAAGVSLQPFIESFCAEPFNLAEDQVLRVALLHEAPDRHKLLIVLHHIAFDGWSVSVMVNELAELYRSRVRGTRPQLNELPIQYADYALWQRTNLSPAIMAGKLDYWKNKLDGVEPLQLITDFTRPAEWSIRGGSVNAYLGKDLLEGLRRLCREEGTTLYMTLLAAFNALLHRYTGQSDICVGSPIAGRQHKEVEGLIGFFVNTLVLRNEVSGKMSFRSLMQQVRQSTLEAYEHQDVPFERVVKALGQEREINRHPLFDVGFQLQNVPEAEDLDLGGVRLVPGSPGEITALSDLSFDIKESEDVLSLRMIYCSDLYKESTVGRMLEHYVNLLQSIVSDADAHIGSLNFIGKEEEGQLLGFGTSVVDLPEHETVISLFRKQVKETPAATALVSEGESLSYQELDRRSSQVARYLRMNGVKAGDPVVLSVKRSPESIVGLLGIMKAGAAFVPIDSQDSDSRLAFIFEDTGCNVCLAEPELSQRIQKALPASSIRFISLLEEQEAIAATAIRQLPAVKPEQTAFIIYTSDSTGKPKGVMIGHSHLTDHVFGMFESASLRCCSSFALFDSLVADAGYSVLFPALLSGGAVHMLSEEMLPDGARLTEYLDHHCIDGIRMAPSVWLSYHDNNHTLLPLKVLVFGGEAFPPKLIDILGSRYDGKVFNLYGPTEATIGKCIFPVDLSVPLQSVPVGKPFSNTRAYILNPEGRLCPAGVAGELYLGGEGISRGYLGREALTSERFLPDPFVPGGRVYRTGDICRWLEDGNIEYRGRNDGQVNIRGHRIELGEIESALTRLPEVKAGCVLLKKENEASEKLVAYYVPKHESIKEIEREMHLKLVSSWKELYEEEYAKEDELPDNDPEFNIQGWGDSFTGGMIPAQEMREWLDEISRQILKYRPKRVLEIGCGKGLIAYQLTGKVEKYIGTDFSSVAVNEVRETMAKGMRDYGDVDLWVSPAHEVSLPEGECVDTVVLNSIVQYFPGEDYLTGVVRNSIKMLGGKGRIIIGDVRDLRLLSSFKAKLHLARQTAGLGIQEFQWQVEQEVTREEELCFSPDYFYGLAQVFPEISHVDVQWKEVDFSNELSLYRFTAILHVGGEKTSHEPRWLTWPRQQTDIWRQLESGGGVVAIRDVPNPKLWQDRLLEEAFASGTLRNVHELMAALSNAAPDHEDVQALVEEARRRGYDYRFFVAADALRMNLVIGRDIDNYFIGQTYSEAPIIPGGAVTNTPLFLDIAEQLNKEIRNGLQQLLPPYMVPGELTALYRLPLVNGKADRKFLARRLEARQSASAHYEEPLTVLEQRLAKIWEGLLRVSKVGIHDSFFDVGGHSLMATRVVAAIRKKMNVELSIKDLFVHTTIAQLARHIRRQAAAQPANGITLQERTDRIPLSFAQERLWFIDKLQGSTQYHMPWVFRLHGILRKDQLEWAFRQIIGRHEVLRTVILQEEGTPYQVIQSAEGWTFRNVVSGGTQESEKEIIRELVTTPFDLGLEFPIRVALVETGPEEHVLVAVVHHIASDGWSTGILVQELVAFYRSAIENTEPGLSLLPIQYADYAIWQRNHLSGELLDKKLQYWKDQLTGVLPLEMPTDYPRPAEWNARGGVAHRVVGAGLSQSLNRFCQQEGVTPFMALISAYYLLLQRYTNQSDLCVGSPVAGRQHQEVEGLIGFFINTLALRCTLDDKISFRELVRQVKAINLDAFENQELPFERIVEELGLGRDMSRTPLFQTVFTLQNTPDTGTLDLGGLRLTREASGLVAAQFDFGFDILPTDSGMELTVVYRRDLYRAETMDRFLAHYEQVLENALANAALPLESLEIITKEEEQRLLQAGTGKAISYPREGSVTGLFAEQVAKTPGAIALVSGPLELTYGQLDEQSGRLASWLQERGIGEGSLVPLSMNRSAELIVSILAILKAGGAYVPIDPNYPRTRMEWMLSDLQASLILVGGDVHLPEDLANGCERVTVGSVLEREGAGEVKNVNNANTPAYVLYTSGSTGRPKGVVIPHRSIVSLVKGTDFMELGASETILSTGSPSFDASTLEYWGPLLTGGRLVLCPQETLLDPVQLKEEISRCKVTAMWFTAGWFNELVEADLSLFAPLRTVLVGGDRLSPAHISRLRSAYPHIRLVNGYGPTENTTFSLTHHITEVSEDVDIPIGLPLGNRSAYILDARGRICPAGVTGELCVGGDGLSIGYLNNPELTADKFMDDPYHEGRRLYRTGDLARLNADGFVEYLGRKDNQVKIRGFRVETGEIENTLLQLPGVIQAVVVAKEQSAGVKELLGFIVAGEGFDRSGVTAELQSRLPDYMQLSALVELDAIPLTTNGKADRQKLLEIKIETERGEYVAPRNETEEKMCTLWQSLLKREQISVTDNFFELGGHSLLAMRLVAAIRKEMDVEVNVKTFFQLPTIELIARYVSVNQEPSSGETEDYESYTL